ncbi:nucleotide sugar dehydrogenase [Streptomyces sp. NPDC006923]|uniref:nucleotide sugar dehydrogenase n=1 Tax=Streptomyces sp. NPDC006923 TaxID=3155355 RepID=UPI0033CC83F6
MGYVGLPTALGLHASGLRVLGIDHSAPRNAAVRSGDVDLTAADQRRLEKSLQSDDFQLTTDLSGLSGADVVVVCVPTPVDRHLMPDLTALEEACASLVRHARPGQTLILTSTSFVGTTRRMLIDPLRDKGFTVGEDIFVACSPERIDPGNTAHVQSETPRVLGGATAACVKRAKGALAAVSSAVHEVGSPEAAEMTKLYENSFRAVNIALANEFADICVELDLDPAEVSDAAATKPYGFMPFSPGPGVGGHCIPCDPHYLLWQLRESRGSAPLISQAMTAIAERPKHIVARVLDTLSRAGLGLAGRRVVVVGAAYKPGVRDIRHSPAVEIVEQLTGRGADVSYYDPLVSELPLSGGARVRRVTEPRGTDWDLALIHTVHPDQEYGWVRECPMVVDATHRFEPHTAPAAVTGTARDRHA